MALDKKITRLYRIELSVRAFAVESTLTKPEILAYIDKNKTLDLTQIVTDDAAEQLPVTIYCSQINTIKECVPGEITERLKPHTLK